MPISTIGSNSLNQTSDLTINGQTVGKGGGNVATNTAHGVSALQANTTGANQTVVGYQAGYTNTTGGNFTAFGGQAAYTYNSTTENWGSTFIGFRSGQYTTTGNDNAFVGGFAGRNNTTGSYNVSLGASSLYSNTTASNNTAVGYRSLYTVSTGSYQTGVGFQTLQLSTGTDNTALGYAAGSNLTTGNGNTFVGDNAGGLATTGSSNVFVGGGIVGSTGGAGFYVTTGSGNTCLGPSAGSASNNLTTGQNNVYIGYNAGPSASGVNNELLICSGSSYNGRGASTGMINPNGGGVYQGNNSSSWSTTSDFRLKKNIVDNTDGLDKITQIRVRNFEYRLPEEVTELESTCAVDKQGVQLGVIAQELQQVCSDCVKEESTGVLAVDSDNIFWHMVNAIKDLKALVDAQAAEIAELKAKVA